LPSCSALSGSHRLYQAACSGTPSPLRLPSPSITVLIQPVRKIPWRLSKHQKARQRGRLRHVDKVVATVNNALAKQGIKTAAVERWKADMPTEEEMLPKDKYTIFDRKEKKYRKGIHSELLS
jgi:hypothetical protein